MKRLWEFLFFAIFYLILEERVVEGKGNLLNLKPLIKQATDITNQLAQFTLNEILNFNVFSQVFNKTYPSERAKKHALLNFLFNQRQVEDHNVKFKTGLVTFKLGLSKYSDLSTEEMNEKLNRFIKPNTDYFETISDEDEYDEDHEVEGYETGEEEYHEDRKRRKRQADPVNLNYTHIGYVTPVQDQGVCGSCWSFATAASLEAACFKKYGRLLKLSEQQLIDCNRHDEHGNYGCGGGEMLTAFGYLQEHNGLTEAKNYPYEADDTFECSAAKIAGGVKSFRMIKPGNEALLKQMLIKHGPIAIALDASHSSFLNYKSGVYYEPKCTLEINHAMLLVGYGVDQQTSMEYWLIKNSYGRSWGLRGYMKLAMNKKNHCGITEFAVYPICM